MERNYWLDLFSGTTWKEFLNSGADVSGFRESRWVTLQKVCIGDYLICYLTGVSRFIGILEIVSDPYQDNTPIWKDAIFPARVKVKPVAILTPETAVPVQQLQTKLTFFENLKSSNAWTGYFRSSPMMWKQQDGEEILNAILAAKENPIIRGVDPKKLAKRPQGLNSKVIGIVSVPDENEEKQQILRNQILLEMRSPMLMKSRSKRGNTLRLNICYV